VNPYQELMTLLEVRGVMSPAMKSVAAVGKRIKARKRQQDLTDEDRDRREREKNRNK